MQAPGRAVAAKYALKQMSKAMQPNTSTRKQNEKIVGSIASELAAKIYNLEILKKNVEDESGNGTRFFIMGSDYQHPELKDKKYITSCIFKLKSIPAALYKALGGFATNSVNLCKLESFAVKNTFDQVQFYIEIESHIEDSSLQKALEAVSYTHLRAHEK